MAKVYFRKREGALGIETFPVSILTGNESDVYLKFVLSNVKTILMSKPNLLLRYSKITLCFSFLCFILMCPMKVNVLIYTLD